MPDPLNEHEKSRRESSLLGGLCDSDHKPPEPTLVPKAPRLTLSLQRRDGSLKSLEEIYLEVFGIHLQYNNGAMSETARTLGVGRSTLYRWENQRPLPVHIG